MAITILAEPQPLSPVFNDNFCIVESTNKNLDGFRYIADVRDGVTNTTLSIHRITPIPTTKYGKIHLSSLIGKRLTYTDCFPVGSVTQQKSGKGFSYEDIKIVWGEEYEGNVWDFYDFGYAGSINWTNYTDPSINPNQLPRTMLYNTVDTEPPFVNGDYIKITQDDPVNGVITGIHKVLDKEDINTAGVRWILVLELLWQTYVAPSSLGGSAGYADNRKTVDLGVETTDVWQLFNGVVRPEQSNVDYWDYKDYIMDKNDVNYQGNALFMTSIPRGLRLKVRPDSPVFLQFKGIPSATDPLRIIYTYDSTTEAHTITQARSGSTMADFSPSRMTGTPTGDYTIHLNHDVTKVSEQLKFKIDYRCYEFGEVEIAFMDRMGSIVPFQFNLRRTQQLNVNRDVYKRDNSSDTMYRIDLRRGGLETYKVDYKLIYNLNSDALSHLEMVYMQQLWTSPVTWVRFGEGEFQRCIIRSTGFVTGDNFGNTKNYASIDIELSNNEQINW
jgi:hypothetical protein